MVLYPLPSVYTEVCGTFLNSLSPVHYNALLYQLYVTIPVQFGAPVKLHIEYKILQLTDKALIVLALNICANSLSNSIVHSCFDHSMQVLYGYLEL